MYNSKANQDSRADEELIEEILQDARTVAVVGISDKPSRPSNGVARTLIEQGYRVIGVNPKLDEVLGTECYPNLSYINKPIDLLDVFRKPTEIGDLVEEVIDLGIPYLWLQEGVINGEAAKRARDAGVRVVMDRCIAKELLNRSI